METTYAHCVAADSFLRVYTNFVPWSVRPWQLSVSILAPSFQFGSQYLPLDACGIGMGLIASGVGAEEAEYEGGEFVVVI